jgi:ribonuclease P protein component
MRKNSLTIEKDIIWVLRGRPFFSKYFTIKVRNGKKAEYRYTVIVSKKVLKLAVDRNKFKRRVRSIVNSPKYKINNRTDFVVVAKKGVEQAEFPMLKKDILLGFKKLRII